MKKFILFGLLLSTVNMLANENKLKYISTKYAHQNSIVLENNSSQKLQVFINNIKHNLNYKTTIGIDCNKNTEIYPNVLVEDNNQYYALEFTCGNIITFINGGK